METTKYTKDELKARLDVLYEEYSECMNSEHGGTVALADGIWDEIEYVQELINE